MLILCFSAAWRSTFSLAFTVSRMHVDGMCDAPILLRRRIIATAIKVASCALSLLLLASGTLAAGHVPVLDIGSRLELFVDRYLIDKLDGVALRLCTPVDEGCVLKFDRPWEGRFCAYVTVLHDGDVYRLYYRGWPVADGSVAAVTCYAESRDGIHWQKPDLGLFEAGGSKQNNITLAVYRGYSGKDITDLSPGAASYTIVHNFSPFLDTNPKASPESRYKAVGRYSAYELGELDPDYQGPKKQTALAAFISPDGVRWKPLQDEPWFVDGPGVFDSQNVAFWSEAEQQYVLYYRKAIEGVRSIVRTTSQDFVNWSEPKSMVYSDTNSFVPSHQLYTNQTHPYFRANQLYIATAARFMPGRQALTPAEASAIDVGTGGGGIKDTSDAVLMTTRAGTNSYDRTFMSALIRPGIGPRNWVSRTNYPALNVVQTGDTEMSLYVNQDYGQPTAHLRRYSFRIDGLASARAPYAGGELLTKVMRFEGDRLVINFATSAAGFVKVEVQGPEGQVLSGYSLKESREMIGNEIEKTVSWGGKSDLSEIAGRPVRLRFVMQDADLYSMRFVHGRR